MDETEGQTNRMRDKYGEGTKTRKGILLTIISVTERTHHAQ